MKIGIITFYRCSNYGAMLQALALWKYLERRGHEIEFINITNPCRIPLWRCFVSKSIDGFRKKLRSYIDYPISSFAAHYPQTRRYSSFEDLQRNCPQYAAVIVGSDQMWNPNGFAGYNRNVAFLDFVPTGCKRISYAVSFSVSSWNDETSGAEVARMLNEFNAISVREPNGIDIVRRLSGRDDTVCMADPTLLHSGGFYKKFLQGVHASHSFVFSYMLPWSDVKCFQEAVRMIKNTLACSVKTDKAMFGMKKIQVCDWLCNIANAKLVVTNSFHGTVFAILFHTPFVSLKLSGAHVGMNSRISSLLGELGLANRFLDSACGDEIKHLLSEPIDWKSVDTRINVMRMSADRFFDKLEM